LEVLLDGRKDLLVEVIFIALNAILIHVDVKLICLWLKNLVNFFIFILFIQGFLDSRLVVLMYLLVN
jgi:hypothetical protein